MFKRQYCASLAFQWWAMVKKSCS